MRRILVVANQTLGGPQVMDWLRKRVAQEPCAIHLCVPANVDSQGWVHDEDSDHELAARRLDDALARFGELGVEVTGEVGDERPIDAIMDVLRRDTYDEILLSTLPPGVSRWLRLDLVHRVERAVTVPVTHLVAEQAPARTD
jgi:hypothetical protein